MAKITVQKLADMLGLSGAAVSMALHGKPLYVYLFRRVLETARQQGYVPPSRTARSPKNASSTAQDFCPVLLVLRGSGKDSGRRNLFLRDAGGAGAAGRAVSLSSTLTRRTGGGRRAPSGSAGSTKAPRSS